MAARPPQPSPEEAIVLALFDLTNQLTKLGEAITARAGITPQQWMVLLQVAGDPNFPSSARERVSRRSTLASDIAADRGVSRAHISTLVAGLRRRGLLRQVTHAGDRRRKHLELTAAGPPPETEPEGGRGEPDSRTSPGDGLKACVRRLNQVASTGADTASTPSPPAALPA